MLLRILAIFIVFCIAGSPTYAQQSNDSEKRAMISKILDMTGALNITDQVVGTTVGALAAPLKKKYPETGEQILQIVTEEFRATAKENIPGFKETATSIYARYYSLQELKDIAAFYETPTGRKAVKVMPKIIQESMLAGQQWGAVIAPIAIKRIKGRLKEEGIQE